MNSKIYPLNELVPIISDLKSHHKTVVFTNGCFDILHAGHVQYLQEAKKQGDILVIGMNSDVSVSNIKGPKRPIVSEQHRSFVLSGLSCVDYITIFDAPDPFIVINQLIPHVLVKGADWAESDIVGADVVKHNGGKVIRIHLVPDISTTEIINRIIQKECNAHD
ncbi:glycerol-3-phosphate cytidylyltransferase [Candidatus Magnetomorum sp. HK-1]|nr:glycerol-3-phosphate cytidylyltransferase [Candidatus Magnetomorum sp. HK-1]